MKRIPAYLLVLMFCASPLLAQQKAEEAPPREGQRAEAMKKEILKLRAALQAAEEKLAMKEAKLNQVESVFKAKEKAREYQQVVAAKTAEAQVRAEKQMQAQLAQLKDMLAAVESRVGKEHAYAASLRQQTAELQATLQISAQKYGPKHPKVLAMKKQLAVVKNTMEREVNKARREELDKASAELEEAKQKLGPRHPRVKAMEAEVKALSGKPLSAGDLKDQLASRMNALRELEKQMAASVYKGQFEEYRKLAAREREEVEAKLKLTEKDRSKALQDKRTQEMLLMQDRLARATQLAEGAANRARVGQDAAMKMLDKRMGQVEQKLDRIANLLEKLLDK